MPPDFWSSAPLPALRDVIARHNLRADKSLGQHFLLDPHLLDHIRRLAEPLAGVNVIEIGPGPGGLTRALLASQAARILAIEFDPRAAAAIAELAESTNGRLTILHGDAMQADLPALIPAPRAIVANLPYNIGTPLLIRWLAQAGAYQSMSLMFQQEVAERICALPNSKAYGRLSVLAQWLCDAAIVLHIPATAFAPPPKVESALVRLIPKPNQPSEQKFRAMERLTAAAFGQRRKMLRASLRPLGSESLLQRANIDGTRRAETLTIQEFETLMLATL